jgi:hypothetical protein
MPRTTLTLDDDVAAAIQRRRDANGTGLREEVNTLLRAGLAAAGREETQPSEPFQTPVHDSGRMLITDWREIKQLLDDEDVERYLRTSR